MLISCSCGKKLKVSDSHIGKSVRCPGCQSILKVTNPGAQTTHSHPKQPTALKQPITTKQPSAKQPVSPTKDDGLWGDIDAEISRSQPVAFNPASVQLPATAKSAPLSAVQEPVESDTQERSTRWDISNWSRFRWKGIGGSLVVLIVGIFMLYSGGKKLYKRMTIDSEPVAVSGNVVGAWEIKRKRFWRSYILDVAYTVDKKEYFSSIYVDYSTFYDHTGIAPGGDQGIALEYAKSDPSVVRILNNSLDDGGPGSGIAVCVVACIGLAIFLFIEFEDDDDGF